MAARSAAARSSATKNRKKAQKAAAAPTRQRQKKDGTRVSVMLRDPESGFGMAIASDCTVSSFTFPSSPAELSGLTIGSRILSVNGEAVATKKALMNEIKFGGDRVEVSYRLPDEIAAAKVRCASGHALVKQPRIDHVCDLCAATGTHFGCSEGCDYDLCTNCYEKILQKAQEDAKRTVRLQQMADRSPKPLGGQADSLSYDAVPERHDAHGVVDHGDGLARDALLAPAAAAQLPEGWETAVSSSTGETYYVNTVTGETTYDRPEAGATYVVDLATVPIEDDESDEEGLDIVELHDELMQLNVGQLRQRAQVDGIPSGEIEEARDGREPKEDMVALILGHATKSPQSRTAAVSAAAAESPVAALTQSELPAGWESAQSRSTGDVYYVNTVTGETTYDWPESAAISSTAEQVELPAGWGAQVSSSTGETYYVNTVTGETTYDRPHAPASSSASAMAQEPEPPPVHSDDNALPTGWTSATSSEGETYFVNKLTGESTYEIPTAPATDPTPLPIGWETAVSESTNEVYYLHIETGFTTYQRPTDDPADWVLEAPPERSPFERYDLDGNMELDMEELRHMFVELGYAVDDEYLRGVLEHFGGEAADCVHARVLVVLPAGFPQLWEHIDGENLLREHLEREAAKVTPMKRVNETFRRLTDNSVVQKVVDPLAQAGSKVQRMTELDTTQNAAITKHTLLKPKRWFDEKRGFGFGRAAREEEAEVRRLMLEKEKLAMQEEIADQLNATLPPDWIVLPQGAVSPSPCLDADGEPKQRAHWSSREFRRRTREEEHRVPLHTAPPRLPGRSAPSRPCPRRRAPASSARPPSRGLEPHHRLLLQASSCLHAARAAGLLTAVGSARCAVFTLARFSVSVEGLWPEHSSAQQCVGADGGRPTPTRPATDSGGTIRPPSWSLSEALSSDRPVLRQERSDARLQLRLIPPPVDRAARV